jgi:hypothetical protein
MLRLKPTVTALSIGELDHLENRGRYRKFLYQISHSTTQRDLGQGWTWSVQPRMVIDLPFHMAPGQPRNVESKEDSEDRGQANTRQLEEANAAADAKNEPQIAKHANQVNDVENLADRPAQSPASLPTESPDESPGHSNTLEGHLRPRFCDPRRQDGRLSRAATIWDREAEVESWPGRDLDGAIASTSRQDSVRSVAGNVEATPTRSRLSVYNDSLPQQSQPRTPLNLPESRHQSRLGPSTTPARRIVNHGGQDGVQLVRIRRRYISPIGMRDRGFEGLYGGSENVEDV